MNILNDFLGPVPIPLLALIIFAMILGWCLSRFMRMPANFKMKEDLREEIRFRLASEAVSGTGDDQQAPAEADGAAPAEGAGAEPAADAAANKP